MRPETGTPLSAALDIGYYLVREAIWDGERCNWLGNSVEEFNGGLANTYRSLGPDIYGGAAGVALLFAHLYKCYPDPLFRRTALGALRAAISRRAAVKTDFALGVYSGVAGIGLCSLIVGTLLSLDEFIGKGLEILCGIKLENPLPRRGVDVTTGIAGVIPALLSANKIVPGRPIELAVEMGDALLRRAVKTDRGWSWDTIGAVESLDEAPHLVGFAHGAGGIGWSLFELAHAIEDADFRTAGEQAFRYEQSWFSREYGNWPDFRTVKPAELTSQAYISAWCHGAPGIGFSRLRVFELTGNRDYLRQAEIALETTAQSLRAVADSNYSLCHGCSGNADLFLYAWQTLEDDRYAHVANEIGKYGIERYAALDNPWPCGLPGFAETPNLMIGLAGIAYFYLRLHDPKRVPSVLLLDPDRVVPTLESREAARTER